MTYEFDQAVAVATHGAVTFPERWTMGPGFAHGGYLMSVALAAAMQDAAHPDPVTMSAHFVRPGKQGDASVVATLVKSGRSLSTVRADIVQNGAIALATITTFGDLSSAAEIRFEDSTKPSIPNLAECVPATREANPLVPRMVDNLDLRLTRESIAWTSGHQLDAAVMEGWVSFADGRPIDTVSLPMFADALPPPVFNVGAFAPWTPTIELTIHIRRRPVTERLAVSFRTELIGGSFFESSGVLRDDEGRLVAMSRQLQLIQKA